MNEWNQGGGAPVPPASEDAPHDPAAAPPPEPFDAAPEPLPRYPSERGLLGWLVAITLLGAAGLLLEQQELSAMMALAGLMVAAQAADMSPRFRILYLALAWVVPVGGAAAFVSLAMTIHAGTIHEPIKSILVGFSGWAAIMSLILWLRSPAEALTRVLFPNEPSTHNLRLVARLVAMGLLFALPAAVALRDTLLELLRSPESPMNASALAASLVGYVAVALAGVGFLIRRGPADTAERLGLARPGVRGLVAAALTLGALVALNSAGEAAQRRWFPALWAFDNEMSEALTRGLGTAQTLLLGVSAGVGEEITLRGALQPRLGVVVTALLFAALHVQYSWYGITFIFALGLMLGFVRARTSTTVAILAHAAYDVVAALAK